MHSRKKYTLLLTITLIFACPLVLGQVANVDKKPKELLEEVNFNKAEQLVEYNAVFLEELLYFSSRHRIVKADTKLLQKDDDFTVTLFSDVEPLHFRQESVMRQIDAVYWNGSIVFPQDVQVELDKNKIKVQTMISMHAWDLDASGNAYLSLENRFKAIAGPPPKTIEEIERHRKLKKLKKHQFYGVEAVFQTLDGKKYGLVPLKHTPKYSVLYEINPDKSFIESIDAAEYGETYARSISEEIRYKEYQILKDRLAKEEDKAVKGDLE